MGNNMSQPGQEDASATDGVALNLPPFIPTDPERWFGIVEDAFEKMAITDEMAKYSYVCRVLEAHDAEGLKDLTINWPANRPYTTLKTELLERYSGTPRGPNTRRFQFGNSGEENLMMFLQYLLETEEDEQSEDSESDSKINEMSNSMNELRTTDAADQSQKELDEEAADEPIEASARCVVCKSNVEVDDNDYDNDTTNFNGQVTNAIWSIVQTLNKRRTCHSTICKSCYNTLTEVDEMHDTLTGITTDMCHLYKKSVPALSDDEDLYEVGDQKDEDFCDNGCVHNTESMQVEPTIKNEKAKLIVTKVDESDKENDEQKIGMQQQSFKRFTGRYACIVCKDQNKESRDTKQVIIAHFKEEHDLRLYFCDTCGDVFKEKADLPPNLYDYATKDEIEFMCEECILEFNNYYAYINDPQYIPWPCKTCGKCFNSKVSLENHKKKHSK